jgi:hypothetical protein
VIVASLFLLVAVFSFLFGSKAGEEAATIALKPCERCGNATYPRALGGVAGTWACVDFDGCMARQTRAAL